VAAGKAHLDLLDHHRRLYLRARALSLAQASSSKGGVRSVCVSARVGERGCACVCVCDVCEGWARAAAHGAQ
jgi:hypothetical protein